MLISQWSPGQLATHLRGLADDYNRMAEFHANDPALVTHSEVLAEAARLLSVAEERGIDLRDVRGRR